MKIRMYSAFILLVLAGGSITISCGKDDKVSAVKTKTELLTTGPWKLIALISNPAYDWNADGAPATDVLSIFPPCEKDNFDTYKTNGLVETNEGPTKCDPTNPQTYALTWEFIDNESKIRYEGSDDYTIVELTATTLRLRATFEENGITYTHMETYSH